MDREDQGLKRVDLKVSVNCCEGCKKKVLKALNIKGVLKTEIHDPSLPKVSVTGNIDVETLIKKLAKIGKVAQVWPVETSNNNSSSSSKRKGQETSSKTNSDKEEKLETSNDSKQAAGGRLSEKEKISKTGGFGDSSSNIEGDGHDHKSKGHVKDYSTTTNYKENSVPQAATTTCLPHQIVNCVVHNPNHNPNSNPNPEGMLLQNQLQTNLMAPHARFYYPMPMEGYAVPMPYSTVSNACSTPSCCIRDHNCYSCQLPQTLQPNRGFADYFNDDNTAGCLLM